MSAHETLLSTSLALAVPILIQELRAKGGPNQTDWAMAHEWANELASHGDELLYKSKKKGETARLFTGTAKVIAVLAFAPGGIKLFGSHWEAQRHVTSV